MVGSIANDHLASWLVVRLCRPGMTFLDVGSHIGSVVATVSRHDSSIKIHAFEAVAEKAARLRSRFPRATVHDCAVGETNGEVPFFIDTRRGGFSSLASTSARSDSVVEVTVPIRRLDELVDADDVDVVKIDVEGAELGVFRGGTELIRKNRPTILFESGPGTVLGYAHEDLYACLSELGLAVLVPNRLGHHDDGLTLDGFLESHLYPRRTTDYFAIPRERRTEIRDRARALLGIVPATEAQGRVSS